MGAIHWEGVQGKIWRGLVMFYFLMWVLVTEGFQSVKMH